MRSTILPPADPQSGTFRLGESVAARRSALRSDSVPPTAWYEAPNAAQNAERPTVPVMVGRIGRCA